MESEVEGPFAILGDCYTVPFEASPRAQNLTRVLLVGHRFQVMASWEESGKIVEEVTRAGEVVSVGLSLFSLLVGVYIPRISCQQQRIYCILACPHRT